MLRRLTFLTLVLVTPLAAQVPTTPPPVAPKGSVTPVVPAPPATRAPSSWWRGQTDEYRQQARNLAWQYADLASTYQDYSFNYNFDGIHRLMPEAFATGWSNDAFSSYPAGPRSPWAKSDPADSLYRAAREQLNRGDYRRAVTQFKEIPAKFPNSVYVNDAMYWQAFALYRLGGTPELQEALAVLEVLKAKAPAEEAPRRNAARSSGGTNVDVATSVSANVATSVSTTSSRNALDRSINSAVGNAIAFYVDRGGIDATALAARIANVLSQRGLANDAAVKRALAAGANSCDREDQQVRAEALSALMQSDPEMARQSATRILTRKDDCSVPLRRTAVGLVASRKDDAAVAVLIPIAKSDPSLQVRGAAIDYLGRMPGDAALNALQDVATSATDESIQNAAARGIASSENPRARTALRALFEKKDASLGLRFSALEAFGRNSTAEDAAWLRSMYGTMTDPRLKAASARVVGRIGGSANDQWLAALVSNENEPIEARMTALEQAGRSMDIVELGKLYDGSSQRQVRQTVVDLLSSRKEPAAVDKLIDIAKNGTDPGMRRMAISALARSKDPRAQKLLLDLVDHE